MAEPQVPQREIRQWLSALTRGSRRWIQATVVAGSLAGLATIGQMVLLAWIIHQGVIEEQPASLLIPAFLGLLAALLLRAVFQGLQTRFAARASGQVRRQAREQLRNHWQSQGPVALADASAASLTREWLDHVEALHGYFARFLPQMTLSLIVPLLILALVFWLDWLAGLFLLLSAPLIPLFMALVGMGAEKVNQQHFEVVSRLSGQFLDKIRGLTTLQLFGQTDSARETLRKRSDQYRRVTMKTLKVAFLSSAVLEFFSSVAIAVIAIYVGFGLLGYIDYGPSDQLTLFSGLLVLLLAPEFFQPLRTLSQYYHDRASAMGAAAEILGRLNDTGETPSPTDRRLGRVSKNMIDLQGISVRYGDKDNRPVLEQVDLTLPRGYSVALTGPTGSGKSSLLHVMAGFLVPASGVATVFGEAPGAKPFGWLGQKGFWIQGTWADNLRLTSPDASDEAIRQALGQVGLDQLVAGREQGINSPLSESGQGLSGGQARRLSLARIFLADYDLILLDEPTAGLDANSEQQVINALKALHAKGKTLVFSTHHSALLSLADRVLVVENREVRDA